MTTTNIYLHQEEPTEPSGDGSILTSTFNDSETEYSGSAGVIKSFTSEAGFFTHDQDLGADPDDVWVIHFSAKASDVTPGKVATISFYFYKRDEYNNDSVLFFPQYQGVGTLYVVAGSSLNLYPYDWKDYFDLTVTTTDRLRISVVMGEVSPS